MEILIVDDNRDLRESAAMLLEACGYAVGTAENADSALSLLESSPTVRILLTDVMMPGMNGFELATKAKSRWPDLGIIYMTGYSQDELPDQAHLHGALLIKPWQIDELLKEISHCG